MTASKTSDGSNPTPGNPFSQIIASMDGARIPGGCESCDAYQVIQARAGHPDIHMIHVHHDDWCPTLAGLR